jgi:hypothetical protein
MNQIYNFAGSSRFAVCRLKVFMNLIIHKVGNEKDSDIYRRW